MSLLVSNTRQKATGEVLRIWSNMLKGWAFCYLSTLAKVITIS